MLIEDASRFARDLIAQELGIVLLVARGVKVITAAGDDLTDTSDPSRVMMRQIAGAFAQYEKARLVARLRRAREVKGKMGGRKSDAELRPNVVALAKQLRKRQNRRAKSRANWQRAGTSVIWEAVHRAVREQHAGGIMNQAEQASNVIEVWIAMNEDGNYESAKDEDELSISGMKMSEAFRGG